MKYSRVYTMILYKNYASEFYFIKPYSLYKSRWCILPIVYTLRKKDIFLCEPRALAINKCAVQSGHIVFNGVILVIMIKCSHDVRNVIILC